MPDSAHPTRFVNTSHLITEVLWHPESSHWHVSAEEAKKKYREQRKL